MKITNFLNEYLRCIGFVSGDYTIKEGDDEMGYFISLIIPENHSKIGSLLGKHKKNFKALEQLIIVIGRSEGLQPYFILKMKN